MVTQQDNGSTKIQYVLAKTKDAALHIINYKDLIFHRNKNKLKVRDDVSLNGKTRCDRGRGKIIVLAIDDNDSCDSSSTKRKVVHVGGDKSKNIPHANVSIVVPIISLTILFVTTTSSVPEVANTARVLKDVDCSSDSNSEKQLVIDEQIVDDCDDDDVQTDNNKIFQAHFILETIDSGILMVNFLL
ncbi:unnamed protein product [Rotaria magnacalcarata]|uniref:Uncharacterized protein n=1 Tax=Rotaria magnacalcarata TaxID=392030 RepID=A0A815WT18_9BILA|nr:unnamed protein product [Rotaria magnacalcarata]CAF1549947.1 unnamed protein product [Rotaria magnacalcarata]CAF4480798.1 unnamed protein product [Rotaria magnacalcarata]